MTNLPHASTRPGRTHERPRQPSGRHGETICPENDPPKASPPKRQRLGLALGTGGARGLAHIGVLRRLDEAGLRPAVVCGSSIGALIGGLYAAGRLQDYESWVRTLSRIDVLRLYDVRPQGGFVQGKRLERRLRDILGHIRIEDLPITFAAVATDIDTGKGVVLREGDLLEAVRASYALPAVFRPVQHNKRWLVDGALTNPVPVALCRELGATTIWAVSIDDNGMPPVEPHRSAASSLRQVFLNSIRIIQMSLVQAHLERDRPDVVLRPDTPDVGILDFHRAAKAIADGYAVADAALKSIPSLSAPETA